MLRSPSADARSARPDLGQLVHVHQGRGAGSRPATLILGRIGLAALVLAVVVPCARRRPRDASAEVRAHWRWLVVVGLLNTAVPFWLLSWGETRIDSGLASIIQASVPIFNALIAFALLPRRSGSPGGRSSACAIGFVGVALLVGAQPEGKILGALAVVGMALCYAAGGLLVRRHLAAARPQVVAFGTSAVAALARAAGGRRPGARRRFPGWKTIGCVVVLGVVGTAFAYLLFFTIIARRGRGLRLARHVPRAAGRARLRRDLPRRERRRRGARRAGADPRRRRARHRAPAAPPRSCPPPSRRDRASSSHRRTTSTCSSSSTTTRRSSRSSAAGRRATPRRSAPRSSARSASRRRPAA